MYSKIFSILSFLFLVSLSGCFAQSIKKLKVKQVQVSPSANYRNSQQGNFHNIIDGKFADNKILWLDNNTLGWQNFGEITIDLELQDISFISNIAVHTAKNEAANAYLPLNINIFTSINGKDYSHAGDISGYDDSPVNTYKIVELKKDKINVNAKYVKLIVNPQGRLFFTDEITISGQSRSSTSKQSKAITPQQLQQIISKNKSAEINRRALIEKLKSAGNITDIDQVKAKILNEEGLADQKVYQQYQSMISELSISKNANAGINFNILSSPWGNGKPVGQNKSILSPTNLTEYIAIQIVNNQNQKVAGSYSFQGVNAITATVYEAQEVRTRSSQNIPDALNPITANTILEFSPGEKKIIILALESSQPTKSTINLSLNGAGGGLTLDYQSVDLGINKNYQNSLAFNVSVWPYFTYPFFKGREQQIKQDLSNHYSNVFVIPPWVLEPNNITTNHNLLKNYLKNYHSGDKVMLFLNHTGYVKSPGNFMQASWQKKFLTWYDTTLKILRDHNISNQNIYLYPFDEIQEKEIPLFKSFVTWIKSERAKSQVYVTVFYEKLLPDVQPLADVYQLLVTRNDLSLVKPVKASDFWIYDIMDDSKDVDPYSRYRLLAWKAFQYNAHGIGFWAYGEQFGSSIWDDFDGPRGDYNAVYDNGNSIIPSRRWEAFKQGIEDYFILSKYQQKFGKTAAQKLALQVLTISNNQEKAEEIRTLMIQQLSK